MEQEDGWHDVAGVDEMEDGDVIQVKAGDATLALYQVDGRWFATDDRCTHQEASLSEGYLQDDTIECPRHQGLFHVPTGRPLSPPVTVALCTYPVRRDADRLWVKV